MVVLIQFRYAYFMKYNNPRDFMIKNFTHTLQTFYNTTVIFWTTILLLYNSFLHFSNFKHTRLQ